MICLRLNPFGIFGLRQEIKWYFNVYKWATWWRNWNCWDFFFDKKYQPLLSITFLSSKYFVQVLRAYSEFLIKHLNTFSLTKKLTFLRQRGKVKTLFAFMLSKRWKELKKDPTSSYYYLFRAEDKAYLNTFP